MTTPMLLSLSMTGMSFCGTDVGGFFGHPSGELYTRWYQAAAFHPFLRSHAHIDSPKREPWNYDYQYLDAIRQGGFAAFNHGEEEKNKKNVSPILCSVLLTTILFQRTTTFGHFLWHL